MNKLYKFMGNIEYKFLNKIKETKLKFFIMNLLGYRLFLIDKDLYREWCADEEEFNETYKPQQWVFDPDIPKGVYKDTDNGVVFFCNEFRETYE